MGIDRREFLAKTGKYILLTSAAALAWDFLKVGAPEAAPNYTLRDHWWGFAIDILSAMTDPVLLIDDWPLTIGH